MSSWQAERQLREQRDSLRFNVFVIVLLDALALTLIVPILPLMAARFGGGPAEIGFVGAAYPLAQLFGAPIMGALSDRFGRKPVLMASLLGSVIGYVVMALAGDVTWLIVARLIDGLSGGNVAVAQAILADDTPHEERARTFGMVVGSAFGIGFIMGPLITIAILTTTNSNFALVAAVAAAYSAAAAMLTWRMLRPPPARERTHAPLVRDSGWLSGTVVLLFVVLALQQFAFGGFERLFALFNVTRLGIGATGTGYLFIYIGLIVVWVQARAIRKFAPRVGERRLVIDGFIALGVGLALFLLTPEQPSPWYDRDELLRTLNGPVIGGVSTARLNIVLPDGAPGWGGLLWLLVALIPLSVGGAILRPLLNSLLTQQVPAERSGAALGVSAAVISAMNALAPLVGGGLFALDPAYPFALGVASSVIGCALFGALIILAARGRAQHGV